MENQQIFSALVKINRQVGSIGKNQKNQQQNFKYRGIDDVMNELHGLFAEHGVIVVPTVLSSTRTERVNKSGTLMFDTLAEIEFTFYAEDGSNISAIVRGEAMDSGDKGMNKAMSVALKYALLEMFLIPTEEQKDPDAQTHEVIPTPKSEPKQKVVVKTEKPVLTEALLKKVLDRISTGQVESLAKAQEIYTCTPAQVKKMEDGVNAYREIVIKVASSMKPDVVEKPHHAVPVAEPSSEDYDKMPF